MLTQCTDWAVMLVCRGQKNPALLLQSNNRLNASCESIQKDVHNHIRSPIQTKLAHHGILYPIMDGQKRRIIVLGPSTLIVPAHLNCTNQDANIRSCIDRAAVLRTKQYWSTEDIWKTFTYVSIIHSASWMLQNCFILQKFENISMYVYLDLFRICQSWPTVSFKHRFIFEKISRVRSAMEQWKIAMLPTTSVL